MLALTGPRREQSEDDSENANNSMFAQRVLNNGEDNDTETGCDCGLFLLPYIVVSVYTLLVELLYITSFFVEKYGMSLW